MGLGADDDAVHRRRLLQSRRGVDDVTGDHRLAERGPGGERDERLAGVDGDAQLQAEPQLALVEGADAVPYGERCTDRPLGVVAESGRRPEDGHDRVADELFDSSAERLELLADELVIRRQDRADVLRVELLGAAGEPDEVDEDNGDDPPLVLHGRPRRVELLAAGEAEAGVLRVLLPAAGAPDHSLRVRRAVRGYNGRPRGCARVAKGNGL